MERNSKIYIAGHLGLVGSGIWRAFERRGCTNLIGRSRDELDLIDQQAVEQFFATEKPDVVVLVAAKVGGIQANNTYRGQFIYENVMIEMNVIHAAYRHGVKKLLFLGSSCIYPKLAPQPLKEDSLLTGPLEPTNEPYAIAKIAGIKLCESYNRQHGSDYRSVMPTNLYGFGDNFHPENSHVLPALIRRFHEAVQAGMEKVVIWGTGTPRREFLHVDDMADAALFVLDLPREAYEFHTEPMLSHVNIGCGEDIAILDLARMVADVAGFDGTILTNPSKPDGAQRKLMNVSLLKSMGWRPKIELRKGIEQTYRWFLKHQDDYRE